MAAGFITNSTLQLVGGFEGCKLNAYLLENIVHIGYGFTYYKSTYLRAKFGRSTPRLGDKITQAEADQEFEIILNEFADWVNDLVIVELNQNQFDALVSLCYNIGKGAFQGSDLLKKLNQGDYSGASMEFSRWVYSNGSINAALADRRAVEQDLFGNKSVFAGTNILLWLLIGYVLAKLFKKQSNK